MAPLLHPLAGRPQVELRVNARARRLSMRVDQRGAIVVVAPPRCGQAEIARFLTRHADWLEQRLAALPARRPFADGATVPLRGVPHRIRHDPAQRCPVVQQPGPDGPELVVGGRAEHLPRRLTDFLIAAARADFTHLSREKAALIGRKVAAVGVRDTRSRWGSCSRTGRIGYCWRLILAPDWVVDYVVAHEVAHLAEPHHQPSFWALADRLSPHRPAARLWLKQHGGALHRYG